MPAPQLVALGYLARMGTALCSAELRERAAALMRGELDEADTVRTVGDLGLMAGAVVPRLSWCCPVPGSIGTA